VFIAAKDSEVSLALRGLNLEANKCLKDRISQFRPSRERARLVSVNADFRPMDSFQEMTPGESGENSGELIFVVFLLLEYPCKG
jgi:hypothetical protein